MTTDLPHSPTMDYWCHAHIDFMSNENLTQMSGIHHWKTLVFNYKTKCFKYKLLYRKITININIHCNMWSLSSFQIYKFNFSYSVPYGVDVYPRL